MSESVVRPPNHPRLMAADIAINYSKGAIDGSILAGKLVKLAAKRFLRDLKNGAERGLFFDKDAAQHVVDFFGFLRHSKGEWGGKVFELLPWQVFILANIFGWKRANGTRRFREAYVEVARKNGKSTFMAGIGLYLLLADDEPGAEVYSAATKKDQAKIVFDEACRMRRASPFLAARIEDFKNNLHVLETSSKFEPLTSEDNTLDGLNAHGVLIDELHAHPTRKLYDVLRESTVARRNPIVLSITTAGYDREGIAYKTRELSENILVGNVEAIKGDYFFAFIACVDEKDSAGQPVNPFDETIWYQANPSLGVSVKLDALREAAAKAEHDPTALNSFLRKHLNVWTSQDVRWMPPAKWAACNAAGPMTDPRTLRAAALTKLAGRMCYGGLDLSSKIDLSAFVLLFPPIKRKVKLVPRLQTQEERWQRLPIVNDEIELQAEDPNWYIVPWFFVPKDNVPERVKKDRVPYDVWEREGFLTTTPGNAIDQQVLRECIKQQREKFQIMEVGFDSWNAMQLANELKADGINVVEVRQGFKTMSEPMKEIMALVLGKKLEHFGNPILSWNANNVAATTDPAGNIKPDKEHSKEKIDGIVALIMGMHRVVQTPVTPTNPYTKRGIVFL